MGKVIELEARGGRERPSKTALVLGGGGFTGAVYEIGALRAFDLMAVNSTVNDFDIYVGTSAGSFVGAMVANGITPDEMMRVLKDHPEAGIDGVGLGTLLRPNYMGYAEKVAALPLRAISVARALLPKLGEFSVMDLGMAIGEILPSGLYSTAGVGEYVAKVLAEEEGRTNDFRKLRPELYLTATDLDTAERVVFGEEGWDETPISKAVECSTALPVVYRPVEHEGRHLIDGGIASTTNIDIAAAHGAELIVVINPLVPFVNDLAKKVPTLWGARPRRVSDLGVTAIAHQTFKLIAHSRLHMMVSHWQERYPGVDIVLIEPEPDDELMFGTPAMDFSQRLAIADHGFQSVRAALATDYDRYQEVAERHGIQISGDRLDAVADTEESGTDRVESGAA